MQDIVVNTLTDLLYCAATGARSRKGLVRDLERLGIDLADRGADAETLAAVWELAARLRHRK